VEGLRLGRGMAFALAIYHMTQIGIERPAVECGFVFFKKKLCGYTIIVAALKN
jgi:hypothetical protein